jgi:hypothetical protein
VNAQKLFVTRPFLSLPLVEITTFLFLSIFSSVVDMVEWIFAFYL